MYSFVLIYIQNILIKRRQIIRVILFFILSCNDFLHHKENDE